jgi:DNA-binding MarR family transcriptional regulator
MDVDVDQSDFEHLLALRTGLRRFLHWSELQARDAGITPGQHQLLLAIKGHPDPKGPKVGEVAHYLVLRHHSAVGLIDRAVAAGLVTRTPDASSHGSVRLALTPAGMERLDRLSKTHLEELKHLAPAMRSLWDALDAREQTTNTNHVQDIRFLDPLPGRQQ